MKICGILAILYMLYFPSDLIVNYKQAAHMGYYSGYMCHIVFTNEKKTVRENANKYDI